MSELNTEKVIEIVKELNKSKIERKGYIILPSLEGFEFYEIDEDRLRSYLTMESLFLKSKNNCG